MFVLDINNGLILCFGGTSSNLIVTFPISFQKQKLCTLQGHQGTAASTDAICVTDYNYRDNITQTHFIVNSHEIYVFWICLGF